MLSARAQRQVEGVVLDASSRIPVVGAAVTSGKAWAISDSLGRFSIRADGALTITCLGYKTLKTLPRTDRTYLLPVDLMSLRETVITAREDHGLTATSKIGEDAIAHIQPSSIADVLELLPGGRAVDPAFGAPQIVNLRAAGSLSSDYATSALGTRFLVDGRPIGGNANLQYSPGASMLGSNYVNLGTDMRTLSTEDIESVEVVRGIASVEYGDLTSGLFKINRKHGGRDLRMRFKSDMKSKLVYAGKGWEWGSKDLLTMNVSANFLDSRADPRNPRQNYKRLTGSWRVGKTWSEGRAFTQVLHASFDYTGSFDDQKSDTDLDNVDGKPIETYRSTYNKFALAADYALMNKSADVFFRSFKVNASFSLERDLIDRWKHVALGSEQPLFTSLDEGVHDAVVLPATYDATLQVDGRPFYAYLHAVAHFRKGGHSLMAGADWNMDKNFGQGSIYDTSRPLSPSMSTRPRAFSAIPASHQFALFAEENSSVSLGAWRLEWLLGLRVSALAGAGSAYDINGRPCFDPRANLRVNLPEQVVGGYRLQAGVFGGVGWHSKFPTMEMLHPEPIYLDYIQLSYWPTNKELRRMNVLMVKTDPTNYALGPARNVKYELGADLSWNGFSFSVDVFREDMTSGFRGGSALRAVPYTRYDASGVPSSSLTAPPALESLPSQRDTSLSVYGMSTNGSRTLKQGVEFTFASKRIPGINTRITANGAWFVTTYRNSTPELYRPSMVIDGRVFPFVGLYDITDGSSHESLTTNVMLDSQVPDLGLIVSLSFQTVWYTDYETLLKDPLPVGYYDKQLNYHVYTTAMQEDPLLKNFHRDFASVEYDYRVPFAMNVNLKLTKKLLQDRMSCSLFVNRILDVTPDYYQNGFLTRRNVVPYFGMELDFRL